MSANKAIEVAVLDDRTSFEAEFPVPFWAEWSEAEQSYLKSEDQICSATALAMYRQAWKAWHGGRAGLTTWMRRAIEAESKLRTYSPRAIALSEQAFGAIFVEPKPTEVVLMTCKLCDQLQADLTALDEKLDQTQDLLRYMVYDYRSVVQAGYDRITALGSDCDSVAKMLEDNPNYQKAMALLLPDLESRPEERGTPETEPCSGCGTPGWTGACDKCVPY